MALYLFIIGFISILGQVILLRELNTAFFGIELIYILALGIWLAGTALGVLIDYRKKSISSNALNILFIIWGIAFLLDIYFIRSIRSVFSEAPGTYLQFSNQFIGIAAAVIPVSIILGLMFRHSARIYISSGNTLAKAYSIESIGGVFGGLASTLLMKFNISNFDSAVLCCLVSYIAIFYSYSGNKSAVNIASYLFASALALLYIFSFKIDFGMTKLNHPYLVETKDTPYGRVSVTSREGQTSVFENDVLSFETESIEPEEFVQLSMLQHPNPQSVLVLGGGIDGTIYELSKLNLNKIDYVELNYKLIDAVKDYLSDDTQNAFTSPNFSLIIDDPRLFLSRCGKYDVILIGISEPNSGQTNRFFTKEFFEQCSYRLNPGGITAVRLRSAENLWTRQLTARNGSVYNSMRNVFHNVIALPGTTDILIASESNLESDPIKLSGRFASRNINTKLVSPQFINYIYTNDRFFRINHILSSSNAQMNLDLKPVTYQYSTTVWLSKFFPDLMQADFPSFNKRVNLKKIGASAFILLAVIFFFLKKSNGSLGRILLVFIAGFIGMVFETMLILIYQSRSGILYQNIGILLTAFMLGLSIGTYLLDRLYKSNIKSQYIFKSAGFLIIILLGVVNFFLNDLINTGMFTGLAGTSFLLLISAIFVAGIFAHASLFRSPDQLNTIAPVYSADVLGGSLGSLLSTFILIPFLGIIPTGIVLAVLALISLLLI